MIRTLRAAVAAIPLFLSACASDPTLRWVQASDSLNAARDTVVSLRQANLIDAKTFVATEPIEATARGALDVAQTQLPEGSDTFEEWLLVAKGGISELAAVYRANITRAANIAKTAKDNEP